MRDLGSLIVVHLVERRPEGTIFRRTRAEWPLHMTLVPWFGIADNERDQLLESLRLYSANKVPFTVHVGDDELFGAERDVPVSLIVEQHTVVKLHDELSAIVGKSVQTRLPVSEGRAYRAHITHHNGTDGIHRRFPGDEEVIDGFTAVRLLDDKGTQFCEIIQNFIFSKDNHEAAA